MTTAPLPVHPFTGLTAIGTRRDGTPIWPVMGGSEPAGPPAPPPPADPPPAPPADPPTDDPLGDPGKKALATERAARKAAEQAAAAATARLKELEDRDKSDAQKAADRLAAAEKDAAEAKTLLLRRDVADEKGLTKVQAEFLTGSTQAELEASADKILAAFPSTPGTPPPPKTPKADPTQGGQGGQGQPNIDSLIADAEKAGNVRESIRLKNLKASQTKK